MIQKFTTLCLLFFAAFSVSCIRSEALNTECDIEQCILPEAINSLWQGGDDSKAYEIEDPDRPGQKITIYPIEFQVHKGVDRSAMAPQFTLTAGATAEPVSGTVRDFRNPQYYKVTSEDRCWSRHYCISVIEVKAPKPEDNSDPDVFSFESARMNKTTGSEGSIYTVFYDMNPFTDTEFNWGSGNSGFALTGVAKNYLDYPTMQDEHGKQGKCLRLTTRQTGSFGAMVNMPIAAGNLFLGSFDVSSALSNSLKSTKFGMSWGKVPTRVSGFFKYRSGDTFYELDKSAPNKMREVPGKRDQFNIVALFYEYDTETPSLDGTNYMDPTSPEFQKYVMSFAKIAPECLVETERWTQFSLDMQPLPGKTIDPQKLIEHKYKFAIVLTSSIHGDTFSGAPGSTLWIDEVRVDYAR